MQDDLRPVRIPLPAKEDQNVSWTEKHQSKVRVFDKLRSIIAERAQPLGIGLKNQCFAGIAIEMAKGEEERLVSYLGCSMKEWKAAIKNREEADQSPLGQIENKSDLRISRRHPQHLQKTPIDNDPILVAQVTGPEQALQALLSSIDRVIS